MSETIKLKAAQAGRRLDVALSGLTGRSRSYWQSKIKAGRVLVDGVQARPSYVASGGETVKIEADPVGNLPALPMPEVRVLYKDRDIIVIDKPAGLVAHSSKPREPSVAAALSGEVEDLDEERPGIVHRLDKDTSGVMVVARNAAAKSFLQAQFAGREVSKRYRLLVRGTPRESEAVIKLPVGRSKGRPTSRAVRREGREAITRYRVLDRYSGYSLIEAQPETGRTHQIRVHFSHIGHPVAGDVTYGEKRRPAGLHRQFLHAASLAFKLPSGGRRTFESPLPNDLAAFLDQLKKRV